MPCPSTSRSHEELTARETHFQFPHRQTAAAGFRPRGSNLEYPPARRSRHPPPDERCVPFMDRVTHPLSESMAASKLQALARSKQARALAIAKRRGLPIISEAQCPHPRGIPSPESVTTRRFDQSGFLVPAVLSQKQAVGRQCSPASPCVRKMTTDEAMIEAFVRKGKKPLSWGAMRSDLATLEGFARGRGLSTMPAPISSGHAEMQDFHFDNELEGQRLAPPRMRRSSGDDIPNLGSELLTTQR